MNKQTMVIFALVAVLIGSNLFQWTESNEARRIEKQREKKHLEQKDDTIRILIKQMREQDLAYLKALQAEKIRADRAEEQLQKKVTTHENIVFKPIPNDTVRKREIAGLYPSFRNR